MDNTRALWADLKRATRRRTRAADEHAAANAACRQAVIALLRAGTRPSELYGNPYSAAYVSRIQSAEGLTRATRETGPADVNPQIQQ